MWRTRGGSAVRSAPTTLRGQGYKGREGAVKVPASCTCPPVAPPIQYYTRNECFLGMLSWVDQSPVGLPPQGWVYVALKFFYLATELCFKTV